MPFNQAYLSNIGSDLGIILPDQASWTWQYETTDSAAEVRGDYFPNSSGIRKSDEIKVIEVDNHDRTKRTFTSIYYLTVVNVTP